MFPIQMTFTVSTAAELAKLVAATGAQISVDAPQPAAKPATTEAKKETAPPKPEPAAASAAPPAATPATPAPTAAASGGEINFVEQIQKPIVRLAANGQRDKAVEILTALGAKKASEIKPEDYAKAVELIKAAE